MKILLSLLLLAEVFNLPKLNFPLINDVRPGVNINIQGGLSITLAPVDRDILVQSQLDAAIVFIGRRLDSQSIYERNLIIDKANGHIIVEIPYNSKANSQSGLLASASDYDTRKTIADYIGKYGYLTFRPYDEYNTGEDGKVIISDEILVDGRHIADVNTTFQNNMFDVALKFNAEGTIQFADATQRYLNRKIGIYMDDDLLTAPTVQTVITGGEAIITGNYTKESADMLVALIRSGKMPLKLEPVEIKWVDPPR